MDDSAAPRAFRDQVIASRWRCVHSVRAKDSTGRWAFYLVYVEPARESAFQAAMQDGGQFDLSDFGEVLCSNYGRGPNQETRDLVKTRFGREL